jgi:cytosine/adenosine deaminase-related metal-dependent hydrolase
VLGRDDIGALAPGMSGDLVAFDCNGLAMAGAAVHDPVAALLFCSPQNVSLSVINGKAVVSDGQLLPLDLPPLIARHNRLARALVNGGH